VAKAIVDLFKSIQINEDQVELALSNTDYRQTWLIWRDSIHVVLLL